MALATDSDPIDATTRSPSGAPEPSPSVPPLSDSATGRVHSPQAPRLPSGAVTLLHSTSSPAEELVLPSTSPKTRNPLDGDASSSEVPSPASLLMVGDAQRFLDRGVIAKGGMGSVHVAFDTVLLRNIAQKFLDQTQESDASIVQQFVEEARITGQLDHPNVVPVHELAVGQDGQLFFTMKYIDGETYGDRIRKFHQAPNDPEELYRLLQVFQKVCDAIGFAHERGVIHCDIKPDNIMVGSFGQVYVMDWGVALLRPTTHSNAVQLGTSSRSTQYVGGTLSYMAPEQAWGRPEDISSATDVYGLGGLLHYLLTGKPPNYDTTRLDGVGNPRNIARESTLPLVPPGLCHIAERALAVRPPKRYATAGEMKSAVETFVAGGGWFAVATFAPGAVILRQGDPGNSAFVITEGFCDCWTETAGADPNARTFIRTMGPGEVFGEMAVLTGRPRSATVTAKTAVKARVITQESLEQELRRNPLLGSFVRTIAGRFADSERSRSLSPDRDLG
jgi:eukaryotic-like serine/threonine-protein kinase